MRKLRMSELKRLSNDEFKEVPKNPLILLLDNVRSTLNVGSIFRTSDAFLVEKIILNGLSPTPENREMRKTALGSTESVEWEKTENAEILLKKLKNSGYILIAFEQTTSSIDIRELSIPIEKAVLIFGNEVTGVQQSLLELCDIIAEIPQFGTKHSLNVSVSAGIGIWEILQKIKSPAV